MDQAHRQPHCDEHFLFTVDCAACQQLRSEDYAKSQISQRSFTDPSPATPSLTSMVLHAELPEYSLLRPETPFTRPIATGLVDIAIDMAADVMLDDIGSE